MSTTIPVSPLPSSSKSSSSTAAPDANKRPHTPDSGPHRPSTSSSSAPTIRTDSGPAEPALATCLSHSHDAPLAAYISHPAIDGSVYDRLTPSRKRVIVALISYCSFLSPIGSTTVLSAIPEVASEYHTTGSVINISSALYMLFMGISPCFWGPASQIFGRRWVCISTAFLFACCSLGTALSPNLASFFVFRILTAFEGTSFLIVGAAVLGDIYRPTERATAMGWFLSGTLIGPALGPFIGGIIVTYTSWRVIFYLQTALAAVGTILAYFLLPETIHQTKTHLLAGLPLRKQASVLAQLTNPWRVIALFKYPPLTLISLCSSSLVWNMYSLLTPIRYVLNPRFGLTSPMQAGLFYLAPGAGYLAGTFVGGRWADYTTKKWIKIRGERVAEDRLRSGIPFLGGVIPAAVLIYGWSVDKAVGGIPLPVICLFVQGVAQLFCFPSLNTYCLDVLPELGAEVIAGNYMVRYLFGAMGTAVVLPAVESIGVGWFSTISAGFMIAAALAAAATVKWGRGWRDAVDEKRRAARREKAEEDVGEDREQEARDARGEAAEGAEKV
ncbi:hypothetical protein O988_04742 [Pseudogymnoascus sp. VKM F-3808]|nr:hypothetical protein O988_04742 [Pseudogymnoascus sp. VKM F-3808]